MPEKNNNGRESYQAMMDMLKEAKESYEMFEDILSESMRGDNVSFGRAQYLFDSYATDEILNMDDDIVEEMLEKIRIPKNNEEENEERVSDSEWKKKLAEEWFDARKTEEGFFDNLPEEFHKFNEYYMKYRFAAFRGILKSYKESFDSLKESKKEVEDLEKETNDIMEEYSNYMCSPEYEEKKKNRIKEMRTRLEDSENTELTTIERKELEKKITSMEKILDNSFLFDRLEKDSEKEISLIVKTFFDNKKSAYIIERFKDKISKVGFNSETYRFFFDLEYKYLPEEYHVYNNLFLFHVMRFIAYINIDSESDRSYVRSIISSISRLIYEKYSPEQKEEFISYMKSYLDYFKEYHNRFEEENILHPTHPKRLERERAIEDEERKIMLETLKINGVEVSDELANLQLEDLKVKYKELLDEIDADRKVQKTKDLDEFITETKTKDNVSSIYGETHEEDESSKKEVSE